MDYRDNYPLKYDKVYDEDITVAALYHMEEGDKGRHTKLISITMGKP
jgi:hypothetical protein